MIENQKIRPAQVIGPLGEPLTIDDLPKPNTQRWVVRRKAEVVAAVNGGMLTIDEVLEPPIREQPGSNQQGGGGEADCERV